MNHVARAVLVLLGVMGAAVAWAGDAVFAMPRDPAYVEECGGCHAAYPPALLPAADWRRVMAGLERHYGSDASLEDASRDRLTQALVSLSGGGLGAVEAYRPDEAPRITRSAFFKHRHDEVPAHIWARKSIGSPANCGACHSKANAGRYPEGEIRIPK
jgi:cytochrome c553